MYESKGLDYVDPVTNQTALHLYLRYARKPTDEMIEYLIKQGCKMDLVWSEKKTGSCLQILLTRRTYKGRGDHIQLLVKNGAIP